MFITDGENIDYDFDGQNSKYEKFENNIFDHQIEQGISNSLNVEILHTTKIIASGGLSCGKNFDESATNTKNVLNLQMYLNKKHGNECYCQYD